MTNAWTIPLSDLIMENTPGGRSTDDPDRRWNCSLFEERTVLTGDGLSEEQAGELQTRDEEVATDSKDDRAH